jgi:glycosyltransferase involved in cell wall biosynthesis
MPISLCLIVKNEEKPLREFLSHHRSLADEIIIVDTGSTDSTIGIAEKFTKKVFKFRWNNNFSEARNFSIKKANFNWILWLDPDEKIKKNDFEKIKELTKNKDYLGYSFIQKTHTNVEAHPRFVKEGKNNFKGYYIRRICKLFRNNKGIKFEYPVHETVINSIKRLKGRIRHTNIVIEHFPENKESAFLLKKQKNYLRLLKNKKKSFPESNAEKEIFTEKAILKHFLAR